MEFDSGMTGTEFRLAYRMTRSSFDELFNLIRPHANCKRDEGGSGIISLRRRVAISFRILAGASYLDVAQSFGVSHRAV